MEDQVILLQTEEQLGPLEQLRHLRELQELLDLVREHHRTLTELQVQPTLLEPE